MSLRKIKPVRRVETSSRARRTHLLHREDLRADFNGACGYCGSEMFRPRDFEIDHFVPRTILKQDGCTIMQGDYHNLVYSCTDCNSKKTDTWPTGKWDVHNDGSVGLVDPCEDTYEDHFTRTRLGFIVGSTALGKSMANDVFKFAERSWQISLFWRMQTMKDLIRELNKHESNEEVEKMKSGLAKELFIIMEEFKDND